MLACWMRARIMRLQRLTLVTGADRRYFSFLLRLLTSVVEHEPDVPVIVYDLGLDPYQLAALEEQFSRYRVRRFRYEKYPPHVNLGQNRGQYAWKPIIVWDVLKETAGPVCWMDAGNVLTARLTGIMGALRSSGFYSPRSAGMIMNWTYPAMLEFFAVDEQWAAGKRNLNGACVAFHPRSLQALKLAKQWRDGALIKECIAPEGSSRKNHRQDQALLTVLAYIHGLADATDSQYLGFETHRDIDKYWRERLRELKRRYRAAEAQGVCPASATRDPLGQALGASPFGPANTWIQGRQQRQAASRRSFYKCWLSRSVINVPLCI
jgi:hypothetical protein